MQNVLSWISNHISTLVFGIIVPTIISAYGPEIRYFLDAGRGKPRHWRLNRLRYKLTLLERLHNSPYNLILHLTWNVLWVFQFTFGYYLAFCIARMWKPNTPAIAVAIMLFGAFGRSIALMETINSLHEYDRSIETLKAGIQRLEA